MKDTEENDGETEKQSFPLAHLAQAYRGPAWDDSELSVLYAQDSMVGSHVCSDLQVW